MKSCFRFRFRTTMLAPGSARDPAEAWIEITPLVNRGPGNAVKDIPYVIYDLDFAPRSPVPVLNCATPHWPADAAAAQIKIWFKLRKSPYSETRIEDVSRQDNRVNPKLDMTTAAGQKLQFAVQTAHLDSPGGGSRIIVTEKRDPADPALNPVKVEVSPLADVVQHE